MISTESAIEKMTLSITEEIRVQAPIDVTFATLIEQLGPFNETPEGQKMNMKSKRGRVGGGTATWGTVTDTSGETCRRSSGRRCWRFAGRCSCRIRWCRICSTD